MRYLLEDVYINPDRSYVIAEYKSFNNGPRVLDAPLYYYEADVWSDIGSNACRVMAEIYCNPMCVKENKEVLKMLLDGKSWKTFTKFHLCIGILFDPHNNEYIVSNEPREKDGGYGVTKGTLTEQYCIRYKTTNAADLQRLIEQAYEDGLAYLRALNEPWCRTYLSKGPSDCRENK